MERSGTLRRMDATSGTARNDPEPTEPNEAPPEIPDIPGWVVTYDDGQWIGERAVPLSHWQATYGVRTRVWGDSPQELRFMCSAEDVRAGFVDAAAGLVMGMSGDAGKWRDGPGTSRTADPAPADESDQADESDPPGVTKLPRRPTEPPEGVRRWIARNSAPDYRGA